MRLVARDVTPPRIVLDAMECESRAEREKRAALLELEGQRPTLVNIAGGGKQASVSAA